MHEDASAHAHAFVTQAPQPDAQAFPHCFGSHVGGGLQTTSGKQVHSVVMGEQAPHEEPVFAWQHAAHVLG